MKFLKDALGDVREWMRLASVRLAAIAGIASGVFTANPELLVGLIGIIPIEPWLRLLFSLGVGAVVFLVPFIVRAWPQEGAMAKIRQHFEGEADGSRIDQE